MPFLSWHLLVWWWDLGQRGGDIVLGLRGLPFLFVSCRNNMAVEETLIVRRWLWEGLSIRVHWPGTYVVNRVDTVPTIYQRRIAYVSLPTEKLDTLVMEQLVDDKGNGGVLTVAYHTRLAQLYLNPNVQRDKSLDPVEVPGVDVDVVDR